MQSRLTMLPGLILSIVLLCFEVSPAQATNINIGTTGCQTFLPGDASALVHWGNTTQNFYGTTTFPVVCSVPHSPLSVGLDAAYFVDGGSGGAGTTVSCALASYNFDGVFLGSANFTSSATVFDQYLFLPAAQVPYWAYTNLWCQLPPGGSLIGVAVIQ